MNVVDLLRQVIPLYGESKHHHNNVSDFVNSKEFKKYLKLKKVGVTYEKNKTTLVKMPGFPIIHSLSEDKKVQKFADDLNKDIKAEFEERAFRKFSNESEKIIDYISPTILGMDNIKKAVFLQLFSAHRIHILLLGDPGVGKTEILRSIDVLAPIASYGLGSGASKAGLTMTVSGKKVIPGLLPMANKGIACIDELNLLKSKDRGGLLNSMEKGFVTYNKGSQHQTLDADARILATANPKGDRFVSDKLRMIKEQLPFEDALMSRFHLVYVVRKPDIAEFLEITKNMLKEKPKINFDDVYFIRAYIKRALSIEVGMEKKLEPMLLNFIEDVKNDEDKFLQEISPRFVKGVIAMAKAKARSQMRKEVTEDDLLYSFRVSKDCLYRNFK